jgi:hypothetical protein
MYREIVNFYKPSYIAAMAGAPEGRRLIVKQVLNHLKDSGFRFVQKVDGLWFEAPAKKSREKAVQALREGAPELRTPTRTPSPLPPPFNEEDAPSPYPMTLQLQVRDGEVRWATPRDGMSPLSSASALPDEEKLAGALEQNFHWDNFWDAFWDDLLDCSWADLQM